eukprot:CAMPEP_0170470292 /NCGR_PEP_ID=MMETSP0123-20130129/12795_1 /TAXON_ID=182087 /ORGANISM="Favella ehrenbergii, Strain Fehren 1" /LENGTH=140 /DNA_ID=CAMNT_0010737361 /DNA_START=56 /DNA_END=474 /DNA_ORIENTATION=-
MTPITFRREGDQKIKDRSKLNRYEEYFQALEKYRSDVKNLIETEGAIDLDSLREDERDLIMLTIKQGGQAKVLFKANKKLYDWQVTDPAKKALARVEREFIPMPTKPLEKGNLKGTMVFTLTAKEHAMVTFDIMQIERVS